MTVNNSAISRNGTAISSGGIHNNGSLTITDSTIAGNSAGDSSGGGVTNGGTLTLTNSTISGNSAEDDGGGVANSGPLTITNSTIAGNSARFCGGVLSIFGNATLNRTLISGNSASAPREVCGRTVTANNFNVFGVNGDAGVSGFTPGATDIVPAAGVSLSEILETSLGNNGGPTRTHALVSGSPAVDSVQQGCPPPAKDQRGISRPQGARCDVGAFELEGGGQPPPDGSCAGKVTTLMGTELRDTLTGTNGADVIQGLGGNDTITGLNGNDTICGGLGNDDVNGGSGNDGLFGGAGDDQLSGADGNDRLNGATGRDVCNGGPPRSGDTAIGCEQVTNVP